MRCHPQLLAALCKQTELEGAFLGLAQPGLSLRRWENRNAGNFGHFSAVKKQEQYFMSQVKCVSFWILTSSLTSLSYQVPAPDVNLAMVLPSGCGGGSGGSSCPAAGPGLCLNDISDLEGKVVGHLY